MKISFELSESDLDHFRTVMQEAREANSHLSTKDIVNNACNLLAQINSSDASSFIRNRMSILETLIGMVVDRGWGMVEEDLDRVVQALSYFSDADDLIPDNIPGLGFLDDAIMIELVVRELRHEIEAYQDFCDYRERLAAKGDSSNASRENWLDARRKELQARMRRRRGRGRLIMR